MLIGLCTELLQAMHGHSILRHRSPVAGAVVVIMCGAMGKGGETAGRAAQKVRQDWGAVYTQRTNPKAQGAAMFAMLGRAHTL